MAVDIGQQAGNAVIQGAFCEKSGFGGEGDPV